jgi:hypothetical protein
MRVTDPAFIFGSGPLVCSECLRLNPCDCDDADRHREGKCSDYCEICETEEEFAMLQTEDPPPGELEEDCV